jgi:DNA processing protein
MDGERRALLALTLVPGLGPTLIGRCVGAFGSAEAALGAPASKLAGVHRIGRRKADDIRRGMDDVTGGDALERELETIERHGATLLSLADEAYPRLLRHIPDPPPLLWVRGQWREDDALAVAIVGARKCSHYGREQAERFAASCAQSGLCIVSGGAYGIDAAAHRAALRVGGRTVAVIGSGLAKPYPADHRELFAEIVQSGVVMSELPMSTPPMAENFPRRNRIISGLSLGTLVVEAARRSGAMITARLCVEEHGREAMAVPGRVDSPMSEGCHQMIREGWAKLVSNAADVLDCLGEAGQVLKAGVSRNGEPAIEPTTSVLDATLSEGQRKIVALLDAPRSLDEITAWTGLGVAQVQADLTLLEIRGAVRREQGLFARKR